MAQPIQMTNSTTGQTRFAYDGFSWTTLFFGPFPALFRGHLVAALVIAVVTLVTIGVGQLVIAFFYNRWHQGSLLKRGFRVTGQGMGLIQNNINVVTR